MPQLPPEIIGHILSELVRDGATEDGEIDTRTLCSCCLVSKAFLELSRQALYLRRPLIFSGEHSDDSVNLDERTLKHALALLVTPHLASYTRALSVKVKAESKLWMSSNFVPTALLAALRASPAIRHLELDFSGMRLHLQQTLRPIAAIILVAQPQLRTLVYTAKSSNGYAAFTPSSLSTLLRGLVTLEVLHLDRFELEESSDFPRFQLQELQLGNDRGRDRTNTIPFLTTYSSKTLRTLRILHPNDREPAKPYDLALLPSLVSLQVVALSVRDIRSLLTSTNAPSLGTVHLAIVPTWGSQLPVFYTKDALLEYIPKQVTNLVLGAHVAPPYLTDYLSSSYTFGTFALRQMHFPRNTAEGERDFYTNMGYAFGVEIKFDV